MLHKCRGFVKPDRASAGIGVTFCSAALISSAVLMKVSHARTPYFLYLLPLAVLLCWSLYYALHGQSPALKIIEKVDQSSPASTPAARLQFLREMRDTQRLTEFEYQEQRQRILEQLKLAA